MDMTSTHDFSCFHLCARPCVQQILPFFFYSWTSVYGECETGDVRVSLLLKSKNVRVDMTNQK